MDLRITDPDQLKRALWGFPFHPIDPFNTIEPAECSVIEGVPGWIRH